MPENVDAAQAQSDSALLYAATLYVAPVAKARPRLTKAGRAYTPKETADAERAVRYALRAAGAVPRAAEGPLMVRLRFVVARPPSARKGRRWPAVRPDLDNYVKLVLDAANGLLWLDDGQIVCLHACKEYGTPPRIEIEVRAAPGDVVS
jgi:Holliday junction resolvase RusA-like endonuclease